MEREDLINSYSETLKDYLHFWGDKTARKEAEIGYEECAFNIMSELGLLLRYSGHEKVVDNYLRDLDTDLQEFVNAAVRHIPKTGIVERAESILEQDVLDDADLDILTFCLLERDGIEAAFAMAGRWSADTDVPREAIIEARAYAWQFDSIMYRHPDALSVATRPMEQLLDHCIDEPDHERYWWFYNARKLDAEYGRFEEEMARALAEKTEQTPRSRMTDSKKHVSLMPALTPAIAAAVVDFSSKAEGVYKKYAVHTRLGTSIAHVIIGNDEVGVVYTDPETGDKTDRLDGWETVVASRAVELKTTNVKASRAVLPLKGWKRKAAESMAVREDVYSGLCWMTTPSDES